MEEKQTSPVMHTLTWGCYTGIALIAFTLIMYVANLYMDQVLQYLSYLLLIGGMVLGALQYRKAQPGGFMTYGRAFKITFLIGLFAAIVSIIFSYFYIKYINTGLIDEIMVMARQKMEAKAGSMSQEQIDQAISWTERFMTPTWIIIGGFLGLTFWSAIFALIISFFLQKKDPNAQPII
ncbi:MAG: DUF4199 domain-containing protein [Bacteroidetes bacterium]|nr:DUF4199 domain-containing protein [Bacteroidota bacterium]